VTDHPGIDQALGDQLIEMRGDQFAGDENFEVEVNGPSGREYGSGSYLEAALRDAGYGDLADSEWFDDMESHIDSGWQTETDNDAYQEAIDDFMERWNDGHYDDGYSEGEDAFYDIDEVARLDYSHYAGLADLYDNVLPNEIKKEWGKKYGVEVTESSTLGKLTTEGRRDALTDRGNVPLWEIRIPPEMAEDVRAGQTFFQTATPISDSMGVEVKGAVELLGNRKYRLTLFNGADISTVIHELGHISLHDLDPDSMNTIGRSWPGSPQLPRRASGRATTTSATPAPGSASSPPATPRPRACAAPSAGSWTGCARSTTASRRSTSRSPPRCSGCWRRGSARSGLTRATGSTGTPS
jgi:hypothetical protein